MIPTRAQWKKWNLLSKVSYVSFILGIVGVVLAIVPLLPQSVPTAALTLSGRVIDRSSNEGVSGASIDAPALQKKVETDQLGYFRIEATELESDLRYEILVYKTGYTSARQQAATSSTGILIYLDRE